MWFIPESCSLKAFRHPFLLKALENENPVWSVTVKWFLPLKLAYWPIKSSQHSQQRLFSLQYSNTPLLRHHCDVTHIPPPHPFCSAKRHLDVPRIPLSSIIFKLSLGSSSSVPSVHFGYCGKGSGYTMALAVVTLFEPMLHAGEDGNLSLKALLSLIPIFEAIVLWLTPIL